ncbi:MAG: DPP IV N-terminal domain-containing protein, partial [Pyrinomonadaceae bacterium]|nr:DPP IV N-terminal domain-containing protein [Pyrinomonadaceae bacterium]
MKKLLFTTTFLLLITTFADAQPKQSKITDYFDKNSQITVLSQTGDDRIQEDVSPDGKYASFVRGNNLFVTEIATGKTVQLTKDGDENHFNGVLDWVYEEELYGRGNRRGYFWSPDSSAIAFLHFDESPVPKFTVVNHISETERLSGQTIENTSYPKSGDKNPIVTLGIADVKSGSVTFVDTTNYNPEDFIIARVGWSGDSKRVLFQAQNREQ